MGLFAHYELQTQGFDELFIQGGEPRENISSIISYLNQLDLQDFIANHQLAIEYLQKNGVTFNFQTYHKKISEEQTFPFDLIPRLILKNEWDYLEKGLIQRVKALNAFLNDIYHEQTILQANIFPPNLVETSPSFLNQVKNIRTPNGIYIHVAGIDLIRDENGKFVVLEDNLRIPSGVSYVLENRKISKRIFEQVFNATPILPVEDYPKKLKQALKYLANQVTPGNNHEEGIIVILTPGPFNSAYFEHQYFAKQMNIILAEGQDLYVKNKKVYLRDKKNNKKDKLVKVIYKRVSDEYLDPNCFVRESVLGIPGMMEAYAANNVAIANAIGNGVADDKAIFPFVPDMIRFYLEQDPILPQIPTLSCLDEKELNYVTNNIEKLVIKNTNLSGGQEVYIGNTLSQEEQNVLIKNIVNNRRRYIAQPLINFSFSPTLIDNKFEPRRFDFRPYVITGEDYYVMPGGLTRVALKKDGYIVNSCQGGGSKDTWIIDN